MGNTIAMILGNERSRTTPDFIRGSRVRRREEFESAESGYMINIYSSNEKDDDGEYLFENIDGGQFDGNAKDAIEFML